MAKMDKQDCVNCGHTELAHELTGTYTDGKCCATVYVAQIGDPIRYLYVAQIGDPLWYSYPCPCAYFSTVPKASATTEP